MDYTEQSKFTKNKRIPLKRSPASPFLVTSSLALPPSSPFLSSSAAALNAPLLLLRPSSPTTRSKGVGGGKGDSEGDSRVVAHSAAFLQGMLSEVQSYRDQKQEEEKRVQREEQKKFYKNQMRRLIPSGQLKKIRGAGERETGGNGGLAQNSSVFSELAGD